MEGEFILQTSANVLEETFSWKLNETERTLAEQVTDLSNVAKKLDVMERVEDVFQDPRPKRIHLIVVPPDDSPTLVPINGVL